MVIIEGAGSPAEINLRHSDIVNMYVAQVGSAPVILVGDIDKGGVFAQMVGTMALLPAEDRARVAGFLINKFRGEVALLKPGFDFLRERFGIPVLGVVPWIERLRIADEDSVALQSRTARPLSVSEIYIAVIKLPAISNYDDFLALEHETGLQVRFVDCVEDLTGADLVIIPGTKSTASDLAWMRREGIANEIIARAHRGDLVLGICGGYQMLGDAIEDPHRVESREAITNGFGLLPLRTRFETEKITARVRARPRAGWFQDGEGAAEISGYEIHMGIVECTNASQPAFTIISHGGVRTEYPDGAISSQGNVVGTMIHGLFENASLQIALLNHLRDRKGIARLNGSRQVADRDTEYDRLASAVRDSIEMSSLWRIIGI
jgi:adenosylcobyric acid synthase